MPMRIDPTRTTTLRKRFMTDMRKRFYAIRTAVLQAIWKRDVLGLKQDEPLQFNKLTTHTNLPEKQAWRFRTDGEKLLAFRQWLQQQIDDELLLPTTPTGEPWTSKYIHSAYKQGSLRAYIDAHAEDLADTPAFYQGRKDQFLESAFNQPERLDKIRFLSTRTYEELRGVSAAMSQQLNRTLAEGMSQGKSPVTIARSLSKTITTLTRTRAMTIARTEIIAAHSEGQLDSFEELNVKKVGVLAEWSTAGDDRVCPLCQPLEGVVMTIKEARGLIPRHPNCFVSPKVPIYTLDGWKPIGKIKEGDQVLSHTGKFRKVTDLIRGEKKEALLISFEIEKGGSNRSITVTGNHPILTQRGWVEAKDLTKVDKIQWLSSSCEGCGEPVPFGQKYCDQKCQWKSKKHRENMSEKISVNMKDQYESGKRDKFTIIRKAHEKIRSLSADGKWHTQLDSDYLKGDKNPAKRTLSRKKISESKKGDKNPMKNPKWARKSADSRAAFFRAHPERMGNVVLAQMSRSKDKMTWIERKMGEALKTAGLDQAVYQHPVGRLWLDFAFPELKVGVECDGERWHQDKEKEAQRQKRLEEAGWTVLHFSGKDITNKPDQCVEKVCRLVKNHSGEYDFDLFALKKLSRRIVKKVYTWNFSVDADESYIAKGCVVHNCRCAWVPANVGEKEQAKKRYWSQIDKQNQIDKSLKAELPKRTRGGTTVPQTVEEAERRSTWAGKEVNLEPPPQRSTS